MRAIKQIFLMIIFATAFSGNPISPASAQVLDRCEIYLWHMEYYCSIGNVDDCIRWIATYENECE